jgi:multicomponent Na+:H+ antiporter subunit G
MIEIVVAVLMVSGALFMLVAALGIVRMPDVFTRMSCNAKAVTIGLGMLLFAFVLHFREIGIASRAVATLAFVILTVPVASHRIGRSAYLSGSPLWEGTTADEWRGGEEGGEKGESA